MKQQWQRGLLMISLLALSAALHAQTLYRYTNEAGVKVINSSLPTKYAQGGYEIINTSGEILKVVPPAPSADEIEKADREREILNTYNILKRRYSDIDDIERAKGRRLKNIETSVAILKGTIVNLQDQVNELLSRAALQERAGRTVHDNLLKQLADTRAELAISKDLLKYRESEYAETAKKFDQDVKNFTLGEMLNATLNSDATSK